MYHRVSVLEPTLFLAYINDLPKYVTCHISLFADDTLIYQIVNNTQQKDSFQSDIKALENCARTWCMALNVDIFSVIVCDPSPSSSQATYNLDGSALPITRETKYLCFVIRLDLIYE